jgi:hypothetical protein
VALSLSLGCEWQKVYTSGGTMQILVVAWLRQWCDPHANSQSLRLRLYLVMRFTVSARRKSVRVRWSHEDYIQLQPIAPGVTSPAGRSGSSSCSKGKAAARGRRSCKAHHSCMRVARWPCSSGRSKKSLKMTRSSAARGAPAPTAFDKDARV